MIGVEMIKAMTEYNYAYQEKLWGILLKLDNEQFVKELPYSHGSIRNHMVHLASVDGSWLRGLRGEPDAQQFRYDPAEYSTAESVREICRQSVKDMMDFIDTLDDEKIIECPGRIPIPMWQILLHVANHGTDHRSQVLQALYNLGADTFEQDAAYFFFEQVQ